MKVFEKPENNPSDYEIGVMICRMQVHKLHDAHKAIIDMVTSNHKKVILFLGVPVVSNTKNNPLDFATRKEMIQEEYPHLIILPLKDQRYNEKWSQILDNEIKVPFGERTALLYGGRDSFIPHYCGKYPVTELTSDIFYSGTEVRNQVSREILASADFRAGVIHANYAQRPCTYPTVDIIAYNDKGQILLAKKPNENKYRFIGGFVDRTDESYEMAAKREFYEESGGCEIGDLTYIASGKIHDWRYKKEESGIMSILYAGKFMWGSIQPSDDISVLAWIDVKKLQAMEDDNTLHSFIMEEHLSFMKSFLVLTKKDNLIIHIKQLSTEE